MVAGMRVGLMVVMADETEEAKVVVAMEAEGMVVVIEVEGRVKVAMGEPRVEAAIVVVVAGLKAGARGRRRTAANPCPAQSE